MSINSLPSRPSLPRCLGYGVLFGVGVYLAAIAYDLLRYYDPKGGGLLLSMILSVPVVCVVGLLTGCIAWAVARLVAPRQRAPIVAPLQGGNDIPE